MPSTVTEIGLPGVTVAQTSFQKDSRILLSKEFIHGTELVERIYQAFYLIMIG